MSVNISRNRFCYPGSTLVPIFLVALSLTLVGCPGKGSSTGKSSTGSSSTRQSKPRGRNPETILSSVYEMCLPARLGLKTTVDSATNHINDWLDSLIKREKNISLDLPEFMQSKLAAHYPKREMERIRSHRFDSRDIRHLRNQILLRNVAERITKKEGDILQDCTDLFYYTMRNVALIEEKDALPFPPFGILLRGRGTARDRAWIFASLLKQYAKTRIDALILKPKTDSRQEDSAEFLIGVIIHSAAHEGKVYLYDPLLGIPLPSASTESKPSILVDRPATLEEFTGGDAVFERLRTRSNEYRLKPQELKNVTCRIVSDSSFASPRSKLLQNSFDKKQEVLVYEKLFVQNENAEPRNRGLFDRVSHFSTVSWSSEDVSLWPYPEATFRRFENVADDPETKRKIDRIVKTFGAPYGTDIINAHFRSRVAQLMGRYSDALRGYMKVRFGKSLERENAERAQASETTILNAMAADDAAFWSGIVKIEQRNFKSANALLKVYERKHRANAGLYGHCMFWLGYAQMKNRDFAAGVQTLSRIPDSIPLYLTGRYFVPKWRAIRDSR